MSSRMAVIRISQEFLKQVLQLPQGCELTHTSIGFERNGCDVRFRVQGAGWEVEPGEIIPEVSGLVTQHCSDDGQVKQTISWGFPSEGDEA